MQLLVSPRDIEEARHSLAADIIDVKRPAEGSLGANYPWVIQEIRTLTKKPLSAAIGDFPHKPGGAALAAYGAAVAGADYIKIGLMVKTGAEATDLAVAVVRAVKREFPEKFVVIAAYADFSRTGTISPREIVPVASEAGADIAMIDTAIKDGKSSFAYLDEREMTDFSKECHEEGLKVALAGSLRFSDIESLKRIGPDIIGVRGMVCGGDRTDRIREDLVLEAMRRVR